MGRRGPKPQPAVLREIRGNPSKKRSRRSRLPAAHERNTGSGTAVPAGGGQLPPAPKSLTGDALAKWHELAPRLHRMGLLTERDLDALEIYCVQWCKWQDSVRFINEHGPTVVVRNDKGEVKFMAIAPQVTFGLKALDYCIKMADRFGLSPSAREGISIETPADSPLLTFSLRPRNKTA